MTTRVLQLIGSFHQGGSERQAVNLTRLLKTDGRFDVRASTLNKQGVLQNEIESLGLPEIPEFPVTSFYDINFVRQVRRCAAYLMENRVELIHTHDFYTNVFGMAAASLAGIEARIASKRETGGMRSRSQEFVEGVAFGRAKRIVVNSVAVRDHLVKRGISSQKVSVIHNGIDVTRFTGPHHKDSREKLGLPADVKLITLVANLRHPVKNIPMLLRAASRLTDRHAEVHFVVAGEGELETGLKRLAAELGVGDRVHFIGRCTDVPALLSESFACVLTSTAEGFSNSIIEYMAAGRPVVATNVGGAAEAVIDGKTGYLVGTDDDAALAERLGELLSDPNKANALGAAGRKVVEENFSTDAQLAATVALYEEVLAGKR